MKTSFRILIFLFNKIVWKKELFSRFYCLRTSVSSIGPSPRCESDDGFPVKHDTSLQGSIVHLKAIYLQTTFAQAIAADQELLLREFWQKYNILTSIKNTATAWDVVTKKCIKDIWNSCVGKRLVGRLD